MSPPLSTLSQSARSAWLAAPEVREPLERIARGDGSPDDLQCLTDAAPEEQRALVPFLARVIRVQHLLEERRARAVDEARTLVRRALATRDLRTAIEACRAIAAYALLDEPAEPRLVGADVDEPDFALDIEDNEVIVAHAAAKLAGKQVLLAVAVDEKAVPPPVFDEQRIANALADALLAEVQ